ncbi:utp13 [Candida oxycetoniae]|uniref:Utp13 n=1 Tax=Candida oxycetoniae TaxID=497107 RepID=A0AAI9SYN1_9ASCO|nr:utp13 [Candida oxycetoniae]KAI3405194.2 utp13 [Candida oxycetoniae]
MATPLNEDVIITDLETNQVYHKVAGDDDEVITSLCFTSDGRYLAICSQSQQLQILHMETKSIQKTFKLSSPVYISTSDSTSSLFAFGGSDGVITVWDIEGGFITHSLKGHGTTICSIKTYGEPHDSIWRLASGDTMGTVKIWDLEKKKCLHTLNDHNTAVRGVAFDDEYEYFLSGGRDHVVIIYSTKNFKPLFTYPIDEQIEASGFVRYVNNKQYFFTAGSKNILRIWEIKTGDLIAKSFTPLETNEELMIIDVVKLDNNNESMYLVISDQTLIELDLNIEDQRIQQNDVFELPVKRKIAGNQGIIADIKYAGPNHNLLVMATNSPALRIMSFDKPFELRSYEGHTDLLNAVDVSHDGRWIATASKDKEARLWAWDEEKQDFENFAVFQGHAGPVTAISLNKTTPSSSSSSAAAAAAPVFLITGSSDLTIKKWKIPKEKGQVIKHSVFTRRAHDKDINAIDVSPNDEFFATASYDKLGKVWSTESGETVGVLKGHKRGLWDINFYKYDKLIVTGSGDKTVKVWSLSDYTCKKTFEGHTNAVQRVKFFNSVSPQLISTGADGLVKVWDYKSGETVKTLDNHDNRIWALGIKDEEGDSFTTADADGKITQWQDNTAEENRLQEVQKKNKIEQEQNLSNSMKNQDWSNAFLLALTLNHSMRLYHVIKSSIEANVDSESAIGSFELETTIGNLNNEQLLCLFKRIRDWNINFKFFEISQSLLHVILHNFSIDKLIEIPGIMKIVESIIPYNERHYSRLDELIEETYVLDYTLEQMNQLSMT